MRVMVGSLRNFVRGVSFGGYDVEGEFDIYPYVPAIDHNPMAGRVSLVMIL